MGLEVVVEPVTAVTSTVAANDEGIITAMATSNNNDTVRAGLRVPGDSSIPAVVPTSEEMEDYVLGQANADLFQTIQTLQTDALQQSEEKVAIAIQTHALVDGIVQRLDADLMEMETLLQVQFLLYNLGTLMRICRSRLVGYASHVSDRFLALLVVVLFLQSTGAFYVNVEGNAISGPSAKPGDLAAIQVNPTSAPNDWILAKIITHDPQTGYYKLSDEDIESNKSMFCSLWLLLHRPSKLQEYLTRVGLSRLLYI